MAAWNYWWHQWHEKYALVWQQSQPIKKRVFWQWQTCEHELESSEYLREVFGVTISAFLSSQLLWVAERSRTLSGCRCIVTTCCFISQTRLISPPGPKAAGGWPHPRTEARGGHLLDRSIAPYPPPVATLLAPPDRLTSDLRRTPQTNTHRAPQTRANLQS